MTLAMFTSTVMQATVAVWNIGGRNGSNDTAHPPSPFRNWQRTVSSHLAISDLPADRLGDISPAELPRL